MSKIMTFVKAFEKEKGEFMSFWYDRLREIREKHGLNQYDLSRKLDTDMSTISRYEGGRGAKKLTRNLKRKLLDIFPIEDVIYIEKGEESNIQISQGDKSIGYVGSVGGHVITGDGDGHDVAREAPHSYGEDSVTLPYYPEIYASAGGGAFNGFDASSPVSISRGFLQSYFGIGAAKGMHIINVVGDSMEPTLKNGEMIFVNPIENEGFRDGGVYVLMCGETILVKRVRQHPITKEYTLVSDNPEVEDITLAIDESSDCKFVGRVVGSMGVV